MQKTHSQKTIRINRSITVGGGAPLLYILGPCVIESEAHLLDLSREIASIARRTAAQVVFKASFDKANRLSIRSYRGPGIDKGLKSLERVKGETGLPVASDIHESWQAEKACHVLDLIQIPALLSRQTDLLLAAARTGRPLNLKKGQFMAPEDMQFALEKVRSVGNEAALLTERGTVFGYRNLVVDMRSLQVMRNLGAPVILDATHSVQLPSAGTSCSAGESEYIPLLARAGAGAGVDGFFLEVHDNPEQALCDGPNSLPIDQIEGLIRVLARIDQHVRSGGGNQA